MSGIVQKCKDEISIFKTNACGSSLEIYETGFFYINFFVPRLDLVTFIIAKQIIPHRQRKSEQLFWTEFFDQVHYHNQYPVHCHNQYPFLDTSIIPIDNFEVSTLVDNFEDNNLLSEDNNIDTTEILKGQKAKNNLRWAEEIETICLMIWFVKSIALL
ncbi:hypothetical protein Glove_274g11 [Diversispora epigaea]|uniref:Uncharacterized protein n=1 Tax=Diversispora epigaea TaxID=1348612 RepID=A0A397I8Y7_9GLOM|nr:hypothetical protein Glove_274g11 [Diversispora epigaea]